MYTDGVSIFKYVIHQIINSWFDPLIYLIQHNENKTVCKLKYPRLFPFFSLVYYYESILNKNKRVNFSCWFDET